MPNPDPLETAGGEFAANAEAAGLILDPWERRVLDVGLAEDPVTCRWCAFEVAVAVPRQNGKGSIIEALELSWVFDLNEKVLHTAQLGSTAKDAFERLMVLIESTPELKRRVKKIRQSADELSITTYGGGYILFGPRSPRLGRGKQFDKIVYDEALFLIVEETAAQIPTMSTRDNPQVWYLSSPGRIESEYWRAIRDRGRKGSPGLVWVEFSIETAGRTVEELERDGVLDDERQWAIANPSLELPRPKAISLEYIRGERRALPAHVFLRERLGVFDEPAVAGRVISAQQWDALEDATASSGAGVFAVDVTEARDTASITAAAFRPDGLPLVEVVQTAAADPGTDDGPVEDGTTGLGWVVDWFAARPGARVALAANRPAGALKARLAAAGVDVVAMSDTELARASMAFYDGAEARTFRHLGDEVLGTAVEKGRKKETGDGAWRWHEKTSQADITALIGGSMALHLLTGAGGDPVWPAFRRDGVVVDDVPGDGWPRYWAVKFSVLGPSVWQCWAERPDGALVLEHELYRARWSPEQLGAAVRELTRTEAGEWKVPIPSVVLGDAERELRRGFERSAGKSVREPRASLADGLAAVGARLASGRLLWSCGAQGEPDPMLAAAHRPTSTLEELPGYVWDAEKEVPVDGPGAECVRWVVGHVDLRARAGVRFL